MAKANQKPENKRLLIVAHGDLDGIVSAVLVAKSTGFYPDYLDRIRVHFCQPFTVDKVKALDGEKVVIVDVAVNNRDPQMTAEFIRRLGDRLLWWFDHHQGWESFVGDERFVINDKAPSCASLLTHVAIPYGLQDDRVLVEDAIAADTRKGSLSARADLIDRATKANLSDDSIRETAFRWLLGDESRLSVLEAAAERYAVIQKETERLSATYSVTGNVALVDASGASQYDLTQLLLAGQKLALFAVAKTVNPAGQEGLTIATSRKDVNLVDLFELGSGAPFRVSISADRLDEVLEKLNAI